MRCNSVQLSFYFDHRDSKLFFLCQGRKMTTPLATARPPQSLKKPRPLRSVSVQENATQSMGMFL